MSTEWIHRLTRSDGTIRETAAAPVCDSHQRCFAGISQLFARRHDPGATVVHLTRADGGDWQERP